MPKVELVYFEGCPNLPLARSAIIEAGVVGALEVAQNRLPPGDGRLDYSSPSILVDGTLLIGVRHVNGSCTIADWSMAAQRLRARLFGVGA